MKKTSVRFLCALLIGLGGSLFAAVRQVRVTAERAAVYAEPNRRSSRIDIVEKGALLNLFQQQKVRDIWYYVSYISPRYGGRMSGFILDSAVEPVTEGEPAAEKPVSPPSPIETTRKAEEPPAELSKRPAAKVPPEPEKPEVRPAPKPEAPKEKPEVVVYSEVTGITPAPRAARLSLPRRPATVNDNPWAITEPPAPHLEKPIVISKARAPAVSPKSDVAKEKREIAEDRKAKKPPTVSKSPAPSTPPVARETRAEKKAPRAAPATTPAPPKAKPPQPARLAGAGRRPARLAIGLGIGPSFGGAGGSVQFYLSRSLALHAGYGIYPTTVVYSETDWVKNETFWSAGLRCYLMPSSEKVIPYLDAQYGGLTVEAAQVITGIYEYSYIYRREQKVLWGPSLLAGLEVRFGRFALSGGLGASYSLTQWEFLKSRVLFAFEAGLGVRL